MECPCQLPRNCGVVVVVVFCFFEPRASHSRGRFERRWISLIFARRSRIIMIRRERPLTNVASPALPVASQVRGFSFLRAPPCCWLWARVGQVCSKVFVLFLAPGGALPKNSKFRPIFWARPVGFWAG